MAEIKSVVIPYRPKLAFLVVLGLCCLLVLALFVGKLWGGQVFGKDMLEKARLEVLVDKMAGTIAEQNEELSRIRLSSQVDMAALENSRQEMIVLQKSIYQRDEELKLYRELLRDRDQEDGLSVADIRLSDLNDGRIDYLWVARQKTSKMKTLQVLAEIWILGEQNGESVEISIQELDAGITEFPLQLEFKYFSINRGVLSLPDDFEPAQVRLVLRYPWMEKAQFDMKYDWKLEG